MATEPMKCRSILCTPILMDVDFSNAPIESDVVLFDLEDSIPQDKKEAARQLIPHKLHSARKHPSRPKVFLRVNSIRTKDGISDLLSLLSGGVGPDVIHLPKVETKEEIDVMNHIISHHFPLTRLQLIIETAKGLATIGDILKSRAHCVNGLVFGAADFSSDIGSSMNWEALEIYRVELVKAGKLNNLQVIDSPYFDYQDLDGLKKEAQDSYELGFTGKLAIHPSQVHIINAGFLPSMEDVLDSFAILEEASKQSSPIFSYKGRMIGPPILNCARRVIETYNSYRMEQGDG